MEKNKGIRNPSGGLNDSNLCKRDNKDIYYDEYRIESLCQSM